MRLALILVLCLGTISATAEERSLEIDGSGKGAILCVHSLVATAWALAQRCVPEKKTEIRNLAKSLRRLEEFEVANGWTRQQAAGFTERQARNSPPTQCNVLMSAEGGFLEILILNFGAAKFQSGLDDILSVPRKPVWNPCL
ncbi:hypothetical protein [Jiella avicenniae]|uniref:HdeA/HdeB family protein n=1 Tax=Jiella avicenniae TaxID=2907202 RepID=A0A9X1TA43_9HYPH|nr:hypothetical protein [Jiella avicenniae]MCE7026863.1 hypothetical protein [Jiella avicenniae]